MMRPLMCVPKSILMTSLYSRTVDSIAFGGTMISGQSRGKKQSRFETILANQTTRSISQFFADLIHQHARLDEFLHVFECLAIFLGSVSKLIVDIQVHAVQAVIVLLVKRFTAVWMVLMLNFALGKIAVRKKLVGGFVWVLAIPLPPPALFFLCYFAALFVVIKKFRRGG